MSQGKSNPKIQHTPGVWEYGGPVSRDCEGLRNHPSMPKEYYEIGHPSPDYPPAIACAAREADAQLVLLARTAPHQCDVSDCPGPKNLAKLKAAEGLYESLVHLRGVLIDLGFTGPLIDKAEQSLGAWNDAQ